MPLSRLHKTDYEKSLKQTIIENEGAKTKVYSDGVGVPTIAAGYSLIAHKDAWKEDFKKAGIYLDKNEEKALGDLIKEADIIVRETLDVKKREKEVQSEITAYNKNPNAITLSSEQVGELFLVSKSVYENRLKDKIGEEFYNSLKNTKELVALVDLVYNGGLGIIGPKLTKALLEDKRAEAWFEIRYNSNAGDSYKSVGTGIAKRRVEESNIFGLYPTNATKEDYQEVMEMYNKHKTTIEKIETSSFKPSANNQTISFAYKNENSILHQISLAKNHLEKGISELKKLSLELINRFETNEKEKTQTLEKSFEKINSKKDIEEKLHFLEEFSISNLLENIYSKQLIEQYQEKVIENNGAKVSALDFINIDIQQNSTSKTNNEINNKNEEERYLSISSSVNTNQNSNSSMQMIG